MKRLLAFALCATLTAAAQAVTYTWTNAGGTGTAGNAVKSQLTLCLTAIDGLKTGDKVLLKSITLGARTDNTTGHAETIKFGAVVNNSHVVTSYTAQSEVVQTIPNGIQVNASTSTTALKYVFTDGIEISVGTAYNLALLASNGNLWVSSGKENAPFAEVQTSDRVISRGDNTWAPVYVVEAESIAPEPTTLALLALGVAGLALRRRAA